MISFIETKKPSIIYKSICFFIAFAFLFSCVNVTPVKAQQLLNLPVPGTMVGLSEAFTPVLLKGMTLYPDEPLKFDFIIDSGNGEYDQDEVKKESEKLVKYFLASMTVPKDDLWVNLSPYEKDRIIPNELGKTELGRDLLAQDYILKQLTATMMYPENELGKKFWEKVRKLAKDKYNVTDIPLDTFNKVWIMPESASVYEHENTVYVTDSHLKVMLDSDYQAALYENQDKGIGSRADNLGDELNSEYKTIEYSTKAEIIREVIIPEIEKEVNEGKNFAPLRQIYHSLILAKWYKETIKNSLLSQVYTDQNKTAGLEIDDQTMKMQIYDRYMEAYKKGVFDYIKEDYDALSQAVIPRKYFSGGFTDADSAMKLEHTDEVIDIKGRGFTGTVSVVPEGDGAMISTIKRMWYSTHLSGGDSSTRARAIDGFIKLAKDGDKKSIKFLRNRLSHISKIVLPETILEHWDYTHPVEINWDPESRGSREVANSAFLDLEDEKKKISDALKIISADFAMLSEAEAKKLIEGRLSEDLYSFIKEEHVLKVIELDGRFRVLISRSSGIVDDELLLPPGAVVTGGVGGVNSDQSTAGYSLTYEGAEESIEIISSDSAMTSDEARKLIEGKIEPEYYHLITVDDEWKVVKLEGKFDVDIRRPELTPDERREAEIQLRNMDSTYNTSQTWIDEMLDAPWLEIIAADSAMTSDEARQLLIEMDALVEPENGFDTSDSYFDEYNLISDRLHELGHPRGEYVYKLGEPIDFSDWNSPSDQNMVSLMELKKRSDSAMLGRPWTLKGARKILDNPEGYSSDKIIKAIRMVGEGAKGYNDIKRLMNMSSYSSSEVRSVVEGFLNVDLYVKALDSNISSIKETAKEKLLTLGDKRAINRLIYYLDRMGYTYNGGNSYNSNSDILEVIEAALKNLGVSKDQMIDGYIRVLKNSNRTLAKRNAVLKLSMLGAKRAIEPIITKGESSSKTITALEQLGASKEQIELIKEKIKEKEARERAVREKHDRDWNNLSNSSDNEEVYKAYSEMTAEELAWMSEAISHPHDAGGEFIPSDKDPAMKTDVGGIDLNELDVDRKGRGVDIQFNMEGMEPLLNMNIQGFSPRFINFYEIPSVLPLLGLAPRRDETEEFEVSSLN